MGCRSGREAYGRIPTNEIAKYGIQRMGTPNFSFLWLDEPYVHRKDPEPGFYNRRSWRLSVFIFIVLAHYTAPVLSANDTLAPLGQYSSCGRGMASQCGEVPVKYDNSVRGRDRARIDEIEQWRIDNTAHFNSGVRVINDQRILSAHQLSLASSILDLISEIKQSCGSSANRTSCSVYLKNLGSDLSDLAYAFQLSVNAIEYSKDELDLILSSRRKIDELNSTASAKLKESVGTAPAAAESVESQEWCESLSIAGRSLADRAIAMSARARAKISFLDVDRSIERGKALSSLIPLANEICGEPDVQKARGYLTASEGMMTASGFFEGSKTRLDELLKRCRSIAKRLRPTEIVDCNFDKANSHIAASIEAALGQSK